MSDHTHSPRAVVEAYVTGTAARDVPLLKSIFDTGAVMSGWLGSDLLAAGPEPFYAALEANEVGRDYTATIVSVDVTDRIATAELAETNLLGLSFTNHFHLVQQADSTWRITAKLFRHS
ncbi:nuclear transport factor 2 family protein [Actibacterium sp. 188UL27-1]|uniref:nuclear transport factor 2 family protein n=1 Tax=Actibacterium sp. 188UL27-1 TaxID=2786961 RepID=UPI001958F955|nr:nuclear transport factor 2 family protein [Actibacterium sp. 188UL27-1]MBM7067840.1 nuclear transport factor 2 family protein [Actibacterium sp. 188UL27-1]